MKKSFFYANPLSFKTKKKHMNSRCLIHHVQIIIQFQMKQQKSIQKTGSKWKTKAFDLQTINFAIKYQPIVSSSETQLEASIYIKPKRQLMNTPLEIELRGYSHIERFNSHEERPSEKSVNATEEILNETDQKLEINVLMGQSNKFQSIESETNPKTKVLEDMNEEKQKKGEYFLQGCNVLYQLEENSGIRLMTLDKRQEYHYPVSFALPQRLPNSIEQIILDDIYITIKYTLEIKLVLVDKSEGKRERQTIIIPFEIHDPEKQYPYEQLVVRELIRCYHPQGKRKDEIMSKPFAKLIHCLCPQLIYDKFLDYHHHFKSKFQTYDLYHLQLVAVVNQSRHIFLVVRAYQQPDANSLTDNRQKSQNKQVIKEVNSLGEVPNDVSLVSMKHTQRKRNGLGISKVQVQMIGQLVNICTQTIFKRTIPLNQSNYDMVEGEVMVNLDDYISVAKSYSNQLFVLRYNFIVNAIFEEEDGEGGRGARGTEFQSYVVESNKKELPL